MHRYGIRSTSELLSTWNRAQLLIAIDAMFWAEPKETKDYGPVPTPGKVVTAGDFIASFFGGMGG